MRLLFVTRKHPPSVGGMQRLSYHLISQMEQRAQVSAITWGGSQSLLPFFLPCALVKSIVIGKRGIDLVHAGDPVVAPIAWILKRLLRVPAVVTAHGLDVTLPVAPYQWFIPRVLRGLDRIVCISSSTLRACTARGIPSEKCIVIHPGVDIPSTPASRERARRHLGDILGRDIQGRAILLTVGRLVPRKGVHWFVERVLPQVQAVRPDVCYVVVGRGPNSAQIRSAADCPALGRTVCLLEDVSDDELDYVYEAADLFVMPNLPVLGDMEGFGLVALEAAARGLPVLAADLEGIREAVVPERTGRLLEPSDADSWSRAVVEALGQPGFLQRLAELAPGTVSQHFTWKEMADAYEDVFRQLIREQDS